MKDCFFVFSECLSSQTFQAESPESRLIPSSQFVSLPSGIFTVPGLYVLISEDHSLW